MSSWFPSTRRRAVRVVAGTERRRVASIPWRVTEAAARGGTRSSIPLAAQRQTEGICRTEEKWRILPAKKNSKERMNKRGKYHPCLQVRVRARQRADDDVANLEDGTRTEGEKDSADVDERLGGATRRSASTIVKQMKIIHQPGFDDREREEYRTIIYNNVLDSARAGDAGEGGAQAGRGRGEVARGAVGGGPLHAWRSAVRGSRRAG
ncbi:hypothetical protein C8R44DRAFT_738955 [Mycena epipterygia]|nr:hypothetical protein C8R44DRAFT_738955 [Mycena epipterygia]